jgi:Fe-S-cluster formation regulator IscX/YfhJ
LKILDFFIEQMVDLYKSVTYDVDNKLLTFISKSGEKFLQLGAWSNENKVDLKSHNYGGRFKQLFCINMRNEHCAPVYHYVKEVLIRCEMKDESTLKVMLMLVGSGDDLFFTTQDVAFGGGISKEISSFLKIDELENSKYMNMFNLNHDMDKCLVEFEFNGALRTQCNGTVSRFGGECRYKRSSNNRSSIFDTYEKSVCIPDNGRIYIQIFDRDKVYLLKRAFWSSTIPGPKNRNTVVVIEFLLHDEEKNVDVHYLMQFKVSIKDLNVSTVLVNYIVTESIMDVYGFDNNLDKEIKGHQETKKQLQEIEAQLKETSDQLQKTSDHLQKTKEQLQETEAQLKKTSEELEDTHERFQSALVDLHFTKLELQKAKDDLQKCQEKVISLQDTPSSIAHASGLKLCQAMTDEIGEILQQSRGIAFENDQMKKVEQLLTLRKLL